MISSFGLSGYFSQDLSFQFTTTLNVYERFWYESSNTYHLRSYKIKFISGHFGGKYYWQDSTWISPRDAPVGRVGNRRLD